MRNNAPQYVKPRLALETPSSGNPPDVPFIHFASDDNPPPKRTIRGQRRRPGSDRPSSGRAEAPTRDDRPSGSSGGGLPPVSGGGSGYYPPASSGGGGMSGIPGGMRGAAGGGGVLLALCAIIAYMLFGGGEGGQDPFGTGSDVVGPSQSQEEFDLNDLDNTSQQDSSGLPQLGSTATSSASFQGSGSGLSGTTGAAASSLPAASGSSVTDGQTWTIMLYQDADDKVLEQDIFIDFNEAERVGSSDRVNIVAQLDRYVGGFRGDGDWTDTRRFLVQQDDSLDAIRSPFESIGEVDMSNPQVLVDFVTWAIKSYPADKYVLIMSDHGMGWPGGWTDPEPSGGPRVNVPLARAIGDAMYLHEIDAALQAVRDQTGLDAFELVGMDACLMGHMEVYAALTPHARFAATSQEVEPAVGWAYTSFLNDLVNNPDVTGRELGQWIVDSYIVEDQRVVDPAARQAFVGRGGISAGQLAAQLEQTVTLAAVDLSQMPAAMEGLNRFSLYLQNMDQRVVAKARNYAQPFTSIFGQNVPASYIDLAHFAALLVKETGDANLRAVVEEMFGTFQNVVVAEKSGSKKPGATGVSIYFPNSQLYGSAAAGPASYVPVSERFAGVSLWDDFLNFHYTGRGFQDTAGTLTIPDRGVAVEAPGAGTVSLSPLTVDTTTVSPGEAILLSADVDGENLGYIYLFAGFYDRAANSINVIDMDYIDSGDTREVNGIFYPEWGEGAFTLEFEWEPIVFAITDGTNQALALLEPQVYGATPEQAVYAVDGIYTFADGEQRRARALFSNESLLMIVGFQESGEAMDVANAEVMPSPREIIPTAGDGFTVLERWYDLDSNGRLVNQGFEEGGTLTFGDTLWTYEVLDGPPGEYAIGFIVEDLDGNRVETYTDVTVE
ncbi:Clostripain family protease [Candidatus Promineifilum breve]|uniref:Clostripain family protease n=1 Tax=Candidatus Promineifilum breve TaxID=1806508 RepID=A0A160SZ45_9CHLR|nr:Clostripain family protease [Candidatus Promineifilum breve]